MCLGNGNWYIVYIYVVLHNRWKKSNFWFSHMSLLYLQATTTTTIISPVITATSPGTSQALFPASPDGGQSPGPKTLCKDNKLICPKKKSSREALSLYYYYSSSLLFDIYYVFTHIFIFMLCSMYFTVPLTEIPSLSFYFSHLSTRIHSFLSLC